jgi:hypothetical protein
MDEFNIRLSDESDTASIQQLAELGAAEAPQSPALVAELEGEAVAAIGLADGRAVADRRRADNSLLTLLRIRRWETRAIISVFGA